MKNRFDISAKDWDTPERIARAQKTADFMLERFKIDKTKEIFELGTGTGILAMLLSQHTKFVTASDSSTGMLQTLKEKLEKSGIANITPLFLDIEKDEIKESDKYDFIYSSMVMHHLENIGDMAKKLFMSVKDKGCIALIDLMKEDGDFHHDNTGVKHFGFTEKELLDNFTAAGFKNIKVEHFYSIHKKTTKGESKDFPLFILSGYKNLD